MGIALFATIGIVVSIWLFFLSLILVSCLATRRRRSKAQPVDLMDNSPNSRYIYFVTIHTGSRTGSGTSSEIYMTLIGDIGTSQPHFLYSRGVSILQRSDVDTFIVRTALSLGRITAVRFWHYGLGCNPSWFVSRVKIHDAQAGKDYVIICQGWLDAMYATDRLDRTFPVSKREAYEAVPYYMRNNLLHLFRDMHLWLSVISSSPTSSFSRPERSFTCMTILLGYFAVNQVLTRFSWWKPRGLNFTLIAIFGVVAHVALLPILWILAAAFSSRRPYPQTVNVKKDWVWVSWFMGAEREKEVENNYKLNVPVDEIPVIRQPSGSFKSFTHFDHHVDSPRSKAALSDTSSVWLSSSSSEASLVGASPAGTQPVEAVPEVIEPPPEPVEEKMVGKKGKKKKNKGIRPCFGKVALTKALGWSCIFTAISFVLGIFFTEVQLIQCLISTFISFGLSFFIEEPLKCLFVAMYRSTRRVSCDHVPQDPSFDELAAETLLELQQVQMHHRISVKKMRTWPHYEPPSEIAVQQICANIRWKRGFCLIWETILYLVFAGLVLYVVLKRQSLEMFPLNNAFRQRLFNASYPEFSSQRLKYTIGREVFWQWMDSAVVDTLYGDGTRLPLTTPKKRQFVAMGNDCSYLIKPPRMVRFKEKKDLPRTFVYEYYKELTNMLDLGPNKNTARAALGWAYQTQWLNARSGAAYLEALAYTPRLNLFTNIVILVELPSTSGMYLSYRIDSLAGYEHALKLSSPNFDNKLAGALLGITVYLIYFLAAVTKNLTFGLCAFIHDVWSMMLLILFLSSLTTVCLNVYYLLEKNEAIEEFITKGDETFRFPPLASLYLYTQAMTGFVAIFACIMAISVVFELTPVTRLINSSFRRTIGFLVALLFIFPWLVGAKAGVLFLCFGTEFPQFSSYRAALMSIITGLVHCLPEEVDRVNPYSSLFGNFVYVCFLLASLLIAINLVYAIMYGARVEARLEEDEPNIGWQSVKTFCTCRAMTQKCRSGIKTASKKLRKDFEKKMNRLEKLEKMAETKKYRK